MAKDTDTGTDLVAAINREKKLPARDTSDSERAIMERILATTTFEDLFNIKGTENADDVIGRPFVLKHATFNESTFEDGSGVYAVMEVDWVDDGTSSVVTCGGKNVCTQLIQAVNLGGEVPFPLKFRKPERPTAKGFFPLWLEQADLNAA